MVQDESNNTANNNAISRKASQSNGRQLSTETVMVTGTRQIHGSIKGRKMERQFSIPADAVNLQRRVGLFSGVALISGVMIGSGIFVSPTEVLQRTGSVGMSLVVWAACGGLAMLGALAYAELGTMNPSSGAEYAYFLDAFGDVPAFLFSWASTLVLKPSQLAIICLTFAKYSLEAFIDGTAPDLSIKLFSAATIAFLLFINCYSVNLATGVQNGFAAAKFLVIGIICIGGLYKFFEGNPATEDMGFDGTTTKLSRIATAFYSGLWAYDGWNNLNYATEEIKDPNKNLPRSIIIGIPLVTICYILINIAYLFAMTPAEMMGSEAVAYTFGTRVLGSFAWIIPLSVAVSTFGAANGTLFAAGRLCFATSREGQFTDVLSYIHVRRFTPIPALIFHALIAIAMVLTGKIGSLIDFFSFTAWIFYGGAMLAVIVMRFTRRDTPRPYKVPIIAPILVLIVSVYLILAPIIENPQVEYLYASLFIVGGILFYIPFVYYGYSLKCTEKVTVFLQIVFQVAATEVLEEERHFL